MKISNNVLFMLAVILIFFYLMKDRPCNVEGIDEPPQLKPEQYKLKIFPEPLNTNGEPLYPIFPNLSSLQREWYKGRFDQNPIDFSRCGQEDGKCIPCESIAKLASGGCGGYIKDQEYRFDLNSSNAKKKIYKYAVTTNNNCEGGKCGIICDSQGLIKTPGVGFPEDQNGLFCKA